MSFIEFKDANISISKVFTFWSQILVNFSLYSIIFMRMTILKLCLFKLCGTSGTKNKQLLELKKKWCSILIFAIIFSTLKVVGCVINH